MFLGKTVLWRRRRGRDVGRDSLDGVCGEKKYEDKARLAGEEDGGQKEDGGVVELRRGAKQQSCRTVRSHQGVGRRWGSWGWRLRRITEEGQIWRTLEFSGSSVPLVLCAGAS